MSQFPFSAKDEIEVAIKAVMKARIHVTFIRDCGFGPALARTPEYRQLQRAEDDLRKVEETLQQIELPNGM